MSEQIRYSTAIVDINFPSGLEVCRYCPLLAEEYKLKREFCRRTGETIFDADHEMGMFCPLDFGRAK